MADYDFRSLSSYDFALLARDLLQVHLGVRLESFSAGPDSGIDFRYMHDDDHLIVQCKHYVESGFAALASILRRSERKKIDDLAPSRYVLATSVPLTPMRKDEILEILGPHCLEPGDIYGREDLNNLLTQHDRIERDHFKLWLTSETVLRRVLDAGIFSDSEAHLDRVRARLRRYVQNPSFERARTLLHRSHYCIIAGIPGIGKTTLAEVLLADLVDRQGFEAFRIAHHLDEIRPLKNSKRKQVFYFDDFLGKTALEKLEKNEDQRLVELIEEVASNENWRFILTTREYILNSAKFRYEAFAHPQVDFTLCVIKLDDYTRPIRARILYNHIYFSEMPKTHKLSLLRDKNYEQVLRHRNYNPRVIEYMTQSQHASTVAPSLYLNEFIANLDHPTRIWDHAFRYQISEAARHLLLVLSTMPNEVLLEDLETAFWMFYRFRQARFGFSTASGDWNDALKQLDGNFLVTERYGWTIFVSMHNPSVRDFLEDFLSNSEGDVVDLIQGAHFYEQYVTLWEGRGSRRYPGIDHNQDLFLRKLRLNLFGSTASVVRVANHIGEPNYLRHSDMSNESRAAFAVRVAKELKSKAGEQFLKEVLDALEKPWVQGHADREDLARLLQALRAHGVKREDKSFVIAKACLWSRTTEINDFRAIAQFAETYSEELSETDLDQVKKKFTEFAAEYADGWDDDDADWLRQVAADLDFVAERFEVDVSRLTQRLSAKADEIEAEKGDMEREPDDDRDWMPARSEIDDVDNMFQGLREELEG
jgi:hypothetical protein